MKGISPLRAVVAITLLLAASAIAAAQRPELVVQTGHTGDVATVALSPDGRMLASGGWDNTVKLWDVASGKELRTLRGLTANRPAVRGLQTVSAVAFSPDGRLLASGDWNKTVNLWEVATGREVKTLRGHDGIVFGLSFSPDGKTLATAGGDKALKLWDVAAGREKSSLEHAQCVCFVAFSPNGRTLASVDANVVRLWDSASGQELARLNERGGSVNALIFSSDGSALAASHDDGALRLWETDTGRELWTYKPDTSVGSVSFSPDGKTIAAGAYDDDYNGKSMIKLLDAASGRELRALPLPVAGKMFVAFSPDGKTLTSLGWDGVRQWDLATGQGLKHQLGFFDLRPNDTSRSGRTLTWAWGDKIINWDLINGSEISVLNRHASSGGPFEFAPSGKLLASTGGGDTIKLWDVTSGRVLRSLESNLFALTMAIFSPDGKLMAAGSRGSAGPSVPVERINIWDVESGQRVRTIKDVEVAESLAFSPDGRTLLSAGDKSVKLWDVATGRELRVFKTSSPRVAVSPDWKVLATAYDTIHLWDVETGAELKTLGSQTDLLVKSVRSVAFSADGKTLATGGYYNTIKLWDVASGREVSALKVGDSVLPVALSVTTLTFSQDGRTLASESSDGITRVWDLASSRVVKTYESGNPDTTREVMALVPGYRRIDEPVTTDGKFQVKIGGNGRLDLYEMATGRFLASLISLDKEDWAVVTPEGHFDASPKAEKHSHYVVSSREYGYEVINLEQLKWRYYEPGLLRKIFKGDELRTVEPFLSAELYPEVLEVRRAGQTEASTRRTFKLRNRGGGIGRVQVFINGSEYIEDARDEKLRRNPNVKEAVVNFDLKGANARLIAGQKPKVEIVAWNYDEKTKAGYISSRGAEIAYAPPAAAPAAAPELYAIFGGVSDYEGEVLDLRFAAKDARDFYKVIEIGGRNLFGVEKMHLKLLASGEGPDATPTKANFKKAFAEFAARAKPTDVFLVYLAGHGVTLGTGTDTYLYLTREARTTDTSALSDRALREQVGISSEELTGWHKSVLAQKQVLILDTCAAGAAAAKLVEKRRVSSDAIRAIDRMQHRRGFHVLMGSASDAVSYEASQYGQGLLTYSLLQGIKSGEALQNSQIDVAKLFNFAADNVPRLASNIGGIQRPEIRVPFGGASFALGLIGTERDRMLIPLAQVKPLVLRPVLQNQHLGYDNLKLTAMLRDALREASYVTARSDRNASSVVFVDADEMPGALTPAGNYTVEGTTIKITLNLIHNDELAATVEVTGDRNDLPGLVARLLVKLTETAGERKDAL